MTGNYIFITIICYILNEYLAGIHLWVMIAICFHHTLWLSMTWQYLSSCWKQSDVKHSAAVSAGFTAHLQKLLINAGKVVVGSAWKSLVKRNHLHSQNLIPWFGNQKVKHQKTQLQKITKFQVKIFPICLDNPYTFVCNFLRIKNKKLI